VISPLSPGTVEVVEYVVWSWKVASIINLFSHCYKVSPLSKLI